MYTLPSNVVTVMRAVLLLAVRVTVGRVWYVAARPTVRSKGSMACRDGRWTGLTRTDIWYRTGSTASFVYLTTLKRVETIYRRMTGLL